LKNKILVILLASLTIFLILLVDRKYRSEKKYSEKLNQHHFKEINPFAPRPTDLSKFPSSAPQFTIYDGFRFNSCKKEEASEVLLKAPISPEVFIKKQTKDYHQPLNVTTWLNNTLELFCARNLLPPRRAQELAHILLVQIEPYLQRSNSNVFFEYKFKFTPLDYELTPPWVSGYGQGTLLLGLLNLQQILHTSTTLRNDIRSVFNTFIPSLNNRRVALIDSSGHYWIDEYPSHHENSFVLNGHIKGLLSLYDYYQMTKDSVAKELLSRGIITLKRYLHLYRVPNGVNCYDLRICEEDYSPGRTVKQQEWLYQITKDSFFKDYQSMFASDYKQRLLKKKEARDCAKNPFTAISCLL
jgi:hypothetical protein